MIIESDSSSVPTKATIGMAAVSLFAFPVACYGNQAHYPSSPEGNWTTTEQLIAPHAKKLFKRISEISSLRDDWDTYGAKPIPEKAIQKSKALLYRILNHHPEVGECAQPVEITPLPYGGIQMSWQGAQSEVEVEIDDTDCFDYLLVESIDERETSIEGSAKNENQMAFIIAQTLLER